MNFSTSSSLVKKFEAAIELRHEGLRESELHVQVIDCLL
jgi:hypothetical protein